MLERPSDDRPFAGRTLPLVPPSTPALAHVLSRAPTSDPNRPVVVARGPTSDARPTSSRHGAGSSSASGRLTVPTWLGAAVLVMAILTSIAAILGLALLLRHHG
jgi:hypothetical protein